MSKIKTYITGLGIVAGLCVASLPLTSYATDTSGVTTIKVTIDPVISMTLASTSTGSGTMSKTTDSNGTSTGTDNEVSITMLPNSTNLNSMKTVATVSTNSLSGYTLTLKDSDTDNNLRIGSTNNTIPAANGEPAAPTSSWAIYNPKDSAWQAVPISTAATPLTLKNTGTVTTVIENDQTEIKYGVATSASQTSGTYTDKVTYTATIIP